MASKLYTSIRGNTTDNVHTKRFLRVEEARQTFQIEEEILLIVAVSADALYKLPRTILIHMQKMKNTMM